jgi:fermentation-respiration switch protein FrsA (DUF1100 family)
MSDTRHEIARRAVVYRMAGSDAVIVQRDLAFHAGDHGSLVMDVYRPPGATSGVPLPAVIIVVGFSEAKPGPLGCAFKDMEWSVCWGRLIAASGMTAIFYANREPVADLRALLVHVRANAAALGVDPDRLGLFATSGNVPVALAALMEDGHEGQDERERLRCAVVSYGFTLDVDGATAVADASAQWGFVNAAAGKTAGDLPSAVPLLVVRAGRDQFAGLNDALDRFVAQALARNLPLTVVNHPTGPHSFDLLDDTDASRIVIRQMLAFLRVQLGV